MAIDISAGALTALVGLVGVLLGTLIGPFINHLLNARTTRKDILFKRKLEYFERVAEVIEKNLREYRNVINLIKNSKNKAHFERMFEELKKKRRNFLIVSSPLYFNVKILSEKITGFVDNEKKIFNELKRFSEIKTKQQKARAIFNLETTMNKLKLSADNIVYEMKRELQSG